MKKVQWSEKPMLMIDIYYSAGAAGRPMKTSYACQGDRLELQCPLGSVIKVMRANYGRFSVGICNRHGITDWSVNCMAPRSLRILQDRSGLSLSSELDSRVQQSTRESCFMLRKDGKYRTSPLEGGGLWTL